MFSRLEGVDERREVHQLDAFPPREDDRVLTMIGAERERRLVGEVQVDVALAGARRR